MSGYYESPSWQKSLAVERYGNQVLDAIYGGTFIIVQATRAHQKQKIDRFHIHRRDGRLIYRVDYKTDEKAGQTGNLALEHVSVEHEGKTVKRGWVWTSCADRIVSYVPAHDTAYVMDLLTLRDRWSDIQRCCKYRSTPNDGYRTWCYCAPIVWLERNGFFAETKLAVGAQLRLPLNKGDR